MAVAAAAPAVATPVATPPAAPAAPVATSPAAAAPAAAAPVVTISNPIANRPAYDTMGREVAHMTQPERSEFQSALRAAEDNAWAKEVCRVAGKVVTVAVRFRDDANFDVILRGEGVTAFGRHNEAGENPWNTSVTSLPQANPNAKARDFAFLVAPAQMDSKIAFKIVASLNGGAELKWASGQNVEVDLATFTHNAHIPVADISFA